MPTGIKVTREQINAALTRLQAGEPIEALAKEHGVHVRTVQDWRHKFSKQKPKRGGAREGLPREVKGKALRLLAAGKKPMDIATRLGVSVANIYTWKWKNEKAKAAASTQYDPAEEEAEKAAEAAEATTVIRQGDERSPELHYNTPYVRGLMKENEALRKLLVDMMLKNAWALNDDKPF